MMVRQDPGSSGKSWFLAAFGPRGRYRDKGKTAELSGGPTVKELRIDDKNLIKTSLTIRGFLFIITTYTCVPEWWNW